jgi:hypothetical protein
MRDYIADWYKKGQNLFFFIYCYISIDILMFFFVMIYFCTYYFRLTNLVVSQNSILPLFILIGAFNAYHTNLTQNPKHFLTYYIPYQFRYNISTIFFSTACLTTLGRQYYTFLSLLSFQILLIFFHISKFGDYHFQQFEVLLYICWADLKNMLQLYGLVRKFVFLVIYFKKKIITSIYSCCFFYDYYQGQWFGGKK